MKWGVLVPAEEELAVGPLVKGGVQQEEGPHVKWGVQVPAEEELVVGPPVNGGVQSRQACQQEEVREEYLCVLPLTCLLTSYTRRIPLCTSSHFTIHTYDITMLLMLHRYAISHVHIHTYCIIMSFESQKAPSP